ncbi:MAG: hypothetical protein ABIH34_04545 [Nanoarchaeota archaeon]
MNEHVEYPLIQREAGISDRIVDARAILHEDGFEPATIPFEGMMLAYRQKVDVPAPKGLDDHPFYIYLRNFRRRGLLRD